MNLSALIPVGLAAWVLMRDAPVPETQSGPAEGGTFDPAERPVPWNYAQAHEPGSRVRELDYLARTIWGEARGERDVGRIGVAHVIVRRARTNLYGWGDTIEAQVTKRHQFEPWNVPAVAAQMMAQTADDQVFDRCWRIGRGVYDGLVADPTGEADHFVATWAPRPDWLNAARASLVIGGHRFARLV